MVMPLETRSIKKKIPFQCLLIGFLIAKIIVSVQSAEIHQAADALKVVLNDEPTRDQIDNIHSLKSKTDYLDNWEVWMVEFFEEDRRVAFATLNNAGKILERGPTSNDQASKHARLENLQEELAIARQTGNQAEVGELLELIEEIKGDDPTLRPPLNPEAVLKSIHAVGGYEMNILRWPPKESHDDLSIQIERWDHSNWQAMDTVSLAEGKWIDSDVQSGKRSRYRVCWTEEDVELTRTLEISATPKSMSDSKLPIYRIQIPEEGLQRMRADVIEDIEIKGTLDLEGQTWPIKIRLRGASTRFAAKKSYRVEFTETSPFPRDVIYLKAEPMDHTMQQEKLSSDLFDSNDALCFQTKYINLVLNDRYEGVYLDVEPLRVPFKNNPRLDPDGMLIRASTFGWWQHQPIGKLRGKGEGLAHLETFLTEARTVRNEEFETWLRKHMDWPAVRDYLALQTLCHRSEIEADDYFFYQNPKSKRWLLIPWDHNNGNFAVQAFGNRIAQPSISVFPQTIQDIGWEAEYSYMLHSRIFNNPVLRREYLTRLKDLTQQWLIDGDINTLIDENFEQLRNTYTLDPYRTPFEGKDPFLASSKDLKRFSKRHGERLMELIDEVTQNHPPLTIDFVTRSERTTTVRISNHIRESLELAPFHFVFKGAGIIRFIELEHPSTLSPGKSIDLKLKNIPEKAGLLCMLKRKKMDDNDNHHIPISFCFLPRSQ